MHNAVHERETIFETADGTQITIRSRRFASLARRHHDLHGIFHQRRPRLRSGHSHRHRWRCVGYQWSAPARNYHQRKGWHYLGVSHHPRKCRSSGCFRSPSAFMADWAILRRRKETQIISRLSASPVRSVSKKVLLFTNSFRTSPDWNPMLRLTDQPQHVPASRSHRL